MKGILLAGGGGTRLYSLTQAVSKQPLQGSGYGQYLRRALQES